MSFVGALHGQLVFGRRVRVLAAHLAELLPPNASVLDVGAGDGSVARAIMDRRPDVRVEGIDVFVRGATQVKVTPFDGATIPFADRSFDVVMFVDVLHHTPNQLRLLREAARVSRHSVAMKDHCNDGFLGDATLRLMDWVGNAPHGVALPYLYWPEARWRAAFAEVDLRVDRWSSRLHLYPWPFTLAFDRQLHFIARLSKVRATTTEA